MIFEDSSLTDLQKYKKINDLPNKTKSLWTVIICLNSIIWPLLLITPNADMDNKNLNPIVALKS